MCDGAGVRSTADHSVPQPDHPLGIVARAWLQWATQNLIPKILAHVDRFWGGGHAGIGLLPLLSEGGALSELPRSMQWPLKEHADLPHELTECMGNWKAAEAEPDTVSALLEKEISNGWVVRTEMSIEQRHWNKGIAVGKLNVAHAEGKEPRLVLDSTVCGVNPKCNIPERISLPMASDVRLACMPEDTHAFLS